MESRTIRTSSSSQRSRGRVYRRPGESESFLRNVDWFTVILYLLLVIAGVFSI